jgi:hypothetical protein
MVAELLLHVGPEKTGTTTIQASLAASAAELTAAGTFVPLASGESPGHHLPVLREVVDPQAFQDHYAYSQDSLSLEETLADLSRNGCPRMLLSAEDFSAPSTRHDVVRLIERINPQKLTVIHAMRSVVPWLLSWHGQDIKYGLFDRGSWPVDQFSRWFTDNVFTLDSTCALWRQGPWDFELRTLVLPSGSSLDICRLFADCANLPTTLTEVPPVNRRLSPCELHVLQTLNVHTFDAGASLPQRAAARAAVLSTLRRHGVPPHTCDCAVPMDTATKTRLETVYADYVDRIVAVSGFVTGDVGAMTRSVTNDHAVHSRFPTADSAPLCLTFLGHLVDDGAAARRELEEVGTYWHVRADAYSDARDHWHEQAENWERVAGNADRARDFWQEQAENWEKAAGAYEGARDFWHEQAQNWQDVAETELSR